MAANAAPIFDSGFNVLDHSGNSNLHLQANPTADGNKPGVSGLLQTRSTVGTGSDTVVLKLSEDAYQGDAQFTFSVDGEVVGPTQSVTALHSHSQSETFTFKGDRAAGQHRFGMAFTNGSWNGTAAPDRTLYIDCATYDGGQVQNATELMTNSTVRFGTAPIQEPPSQPANTNHLGTTISSPGLGAPGVPPTVGVGSAGAAAHLLHAASAPMTLNDFDTTRDHALTIDNPSEDALKQLSDGHGGIFSTFRADLGNIDLIQHTTVNQSDLRFI